MDVNLRLYESIKDSKIDLILSLPCILLKGLLKIIEEKKEIPHIPITREEEGIGIAAGVFLGGKKTVILMQNSGLGNSINALKSLIELYEIPIILIMSHRGDIGEKIVAQFPMGKYTPKLLESLPIANYFINTNKEIDKIKDIIKNSLSAKRSVAIVLKKTIWSE